MKISQNAVYRLTLLWAFAESGLGGLLHGLHLPITGFILGAFSIVIISLIARYSSNAAKDILSSTLLVLVVKFSVSPHSPFPAYVAVLFQGCAGCFLFWLFRYNRISLILFAILAMVESAVQKPLLATLIFGKEIWLAIDEYTGKLVSLFGLQPLENFSIYFLAAYTMLYACWGLVVALWAYSLHDKLKTIHMEKEKIGKTQNSLQLAKKRSWLFVTLFFLVMVMLVLYVLEMPAPLYYIIKTILILSLVYLVIAPIIKFLLKRSAKKYHSFITAFYEALPALKENVQLARRHAAEAQGVIRRLSSFLLCLLYLNLQDETD